MHKNKTNNYKYSKLVYLCGVNVRFNWLFLSAVPPWGCEDTDMIMNNERHNVAEQKLIYIYLVLVFFVFEL